MVVARLLTLAVLSATPALAGPQWLAGVGAGAALPGGTIYAGPALALSVAVAPWRQVGFELRAEQSFHRQQVSATDTAAVGLTAVGAGVQYRIDLGAAVPYASALVAGLRYGRAGAPARLDLGGSVALGVWVPLWTRAFAGAEARYGFTFVGAAPAGRGFFLTAGFRFGDDPS